MTRVFPSLSESGTSSSCTERDRFSPGRHARTASSAAGGPSTAVCFESEPFRHDGPRAHRVVVTGIGVVTPVGTGRDEFWGNLVSGVNGIGRVRAFDPSGYRSQMAGEVREFCPDPWIEPKQARRMDRFTQFALVAAELAMGDALLEQGDYDETRAGVIIGSGIGGARTIESEMATLLADGPRALGPFVVTKVLINTASCTASIRFGLKGPLSAPSVACSTEANAIGDAFRVLERGDADVMLAGGTEASITPLPFAGFCATRSMSTRNHDLEHASRPFDRDRDGFVMGEGAGVVVLETVDHALARGAPIYAELTGYGNTADAYHLTAPQPNADGMIRAICAAMDDAGVAPDTVDYINAHGTSTVLNDKTETAAVLRVFGAHAHKLKMSSNKSMLGHLLAAAGAVEFAATALSISTGWLPPTINYEHPDPECPLDYVTEGAEFMRPEVALTKSFGFGGGNACLVLRRFNEETP